MRPTRKPTYDRRDVILAAGNMMVAVASVGMACYLAFSVPVVGDPEWTETPCEFVAEVECRPGDSVLLEIIVTHSETRRA